MNLLMHICCANCALYPVTYIGERGIKLKGFWFNPNIHPYTEYRARLEALKELEDLWGLDIEYENRYGLIEFTRSVVNDEQNRCRYCYTTRLEETAKVARTRGMDAFSTTLLVSPYQRFDMINEIGKSLELKYDIEFLAEDFRPGWKEGTRISRELGLYRQKHCGCIYSEMERYLKKK
ncbi:MAG TPA: epoxyqueuosine reductase QueH [Nitrospirae bacterium]|nr:epoxyqueuosine reductase QueH [Nitrospirota bacterium]